MSNTKPIKAAADDDALIARPRAARDDLKPIAMTDNGLLAQLRSVTLMLSEMELKA